MQKSFGMVVLMGMLAFAGLASAETWTLADDFSTAGTNPDGVWTYGWYRGGTADFTVYSTASGGTQTGSTYIDWEGPASASWAGFVLKNQGPSPMTSWGYYEAGQIILHPGSDGSQIATVRWTAPRDMTVSIDALFTGQTSLTTTGCYVIRNYSAVLYQYIDGSYGTAANNYADRTGSSFVAYTGQMTLAKGDFLDFAVDYGSNEEYSADSTGLALTISEVPEPMTVALLAMGGVAALRRRA